jgi:hypothetical protein
MLSVTTTGAHPSCEAILARVEVPLLCLIEWESLCRLRETALLTRFQLVFAHFSHVLIRF